MAYFDYDDRHGCRVAAAGCDNPLGQAELSLDIARAALAATRLAIETLDQNDGWSKMTPVFVGGVKMYTANGSEPVFVYYGLTKETKDEFLAEKVKNLNKCYDKVEELSV